MMKMIVMVTILLAVIPTVTMMATKIIVVVALGMKNTFQFSPF